MGATTRKGIIVLIRAQKILDPEFYRRLVKKVDVKKKFRKTTATAALDMILSELGPPGVTSLNEPGDY